MPHSVSHKPSITLTSSGLRSSTFKLGLLWSLGPEVIRWAEKEEELEITLPNRFSQSDIVVAPTQVERGGREDERQAQNESLERHRS